MVRLNAFLFLVVFCHPVLADADTDPRISRALAVQKALADAKVQLKAHRPDQAVSVLEQSVALANGNPNYLTLMKEAYTEYLKQLVAENGSPDRIDHAKKQLEILDPELKIEPILARTKAAAETSTPPAAPVTSRGQAAPADDPFQQQPVDRASKATIGTAAAQAAFDRKQYAEADTLFREAVRGGARLSDDERQAWGYCRLHEVVNRLNRGTVTAAAGNTLRQEAEEAIQLGGPALEKFGHQVLAEIRKRGGVSIETAVPPGWRVAESSNFRIFHRPGAETQATAIAKAAEQLRNATFEKWSGPSKDWSPRCDLWLHVSGEEYARATEQPASSPGHSSVGSKDGRIHYRRIDLRLDDTTLQDATLPREVAYTVLADLSPEQPLPRWSVVGMSITAASPAEIARYLKAVPRLTQEKKLFSVRDLLKLAEFPSADKITPFYVESVSLVDYLVRLKGAKAFVLYLHEAPRRGYEEALQRHYGIKDADDLQDRWLKFAMKGE